MDKSRLTGPRASTASGFPESDVPVPGMGTVRVRALSRTEVLVVRKATDDEHMDGPRALTLERKMLSSAMVHPEMSESDIGDWQKHGLAGELQPVVMMVQQLSGMLEDSPKSDVPSDGSGLEPGIRALPSTEANDDGSPPQG
jgi:hypothetical protein